MQNSIRPTPAAFTLAMLGATALFGAPKTSTSTTLAFNPSAAVALGGAASAVVTVKFPDANGSPVTEGTVELYQAKSAGLPAACDVQNGKAEVSTGLTGTPDGNGQVSFDLQLAGLTSTVGVTGYIAKFDDPSNYSKSASPCLDLTVVPAPVVCDTNVNATISAIRTSGPGFPEAGVSNTWTYVMRIHACVDLGNVTAQGGNNAWTGASFSPPLGTSLTLRKAVGGKNTVNVWTVGNMAEGTDLDLGIAITGTIKNGTPCGTVVGTLGSWSAQSTSAQFGAE